MQATTRPTPNFQSPNLRSARTLKIVLVAFALVAVITALSFIFSPPGQRYFANQTAAPAEADVNRVLVLADDALNHVFSPAVIQVETGTMVTWEFADVDEGGVPVAHNVVFSDEASPVLTEGDYSRMFAEAGVYDYVCTLHAFMSGRVVVVDAVADDGATSNGGGQP